MLQQNASYYVHLFRKILLFHIYLLCYSLNAKFFYCKDDLNLWHYKTNNEVMD